MNILSALPTYLIHHQPRMIEDPKPWEYVTLPGGGYWPIPQQMLGIVSAYGTWGASEPLQDAEKGFDYSRLMVRHYSKNLELAKYRDPAIFAKARERVDRWLEAGPVAATRSMAAALRFYLRIFYADQSAPPHENTREARLAGVRVIPAKDGFCAYLRYSGKRRVGPVRRTAEEAEGDRIPLYKRVILEGVQEWIDAQELSAVVITPSGYDLTPFD